MYQMWHHCKRHCISNSQCIMHKAEKSYQKNVIVIYIVCLQFLWHFIFFFVFFFFRNFGTDKLVLVFDGKCFNILMDRLSPTVEKKTSNRLKKSCKLTAFLNYLFITIRNFGGNYLISCQNTKHLSVIFVFVIVVVFFSSVLHFIAIKRNDKYQNNSHASSSDIVLTPIFNCRKIIEIIWIIKFLLLHSQPSHKMNICVCAFICVLCVATMTTDYAMRWQMTFITHSQAKLVVVPCMAENYMTK